eukprot:TRINITY_DN22881_c0_g1_i1.p1 TRINITY_DN22881_c0_g1~~TRINITY_DN22881_c0_g1_i1.p1  ORF type:complete len:118 (+),score=4.22 TRINITY_DN22881_c0_g1_i1:93-446(+)
MGLVLPSVIGLPEWQGSDRETRLPSRIRQRRRDLFYVAKVSSSSASALRVKAAMLAMRSSDAVSSSRVCSPAGPASAATLRPAGAPLGCVEPPTEPLSASPHSAPKLSRIARACSSA